MGHNRILLSAELPEYPEFKEGIRRAPDRGFTLTDSKTITALKMPSDIFLKNFMSRLLLNSWKSFAHEAEYMPTAGARRRPQSQAD